MADVPMPRDLSEEALGRWIYAVRWNRPDAMEADPVFFFRDYAPIARAVRALLEAKVREAVVEMKREPNPWIVSVDGIVARVM